MKTQLEIGDQIKRYEVTTEIEHTYVITKVTKTLAKTDSDVIFKRNIEYDRTLPLPHYLGEVTRTNGYGYARYFFINKDYHIIEAQKEIKTAVDIIMKVHQGGEAFFDAMDDYIRTDATVMIFDALFDKAISLVQKPVLVLSGKFGVEVAERIDEGLLKKLPYILFNGGIRSGKQPTIQKQSDGNIDGKTAVFIDDTIYGGLTFRVIKEHLSSLNILMEHVVVAYDGSPDKRDYINPIFRFYDHYEAVPTKY